jgi:hypothetical protein
VHRVYYSFDRTSVAKLDDTVFVQLKSSNPTFHMFGDVIMETNVFSRSRIHVKPRSPDGSFASVKNSDILNLKKKIVNINING